MIKNQLPIEVLEAAAREDVGRVLRQIRLHYGKTQGDVERTLRIRACQIDAIEHGDMRRLPGAAYAMGFVRSYAEYLGVNSTHALQLFKVQYMGGQAKFFLPFPRLLPSETKNPARWLVILSLVLSLSFFIINNTTVRSSALIIQDVPEDMDTLSNELSQDYKPDDPAQSSLSDRSETAVIPPE